MRKVDGFMCDIDVLYPDDPNHLVEAVCYEYNVRAFGKTKGEAIANVFTRLAKKLRKETREILAQGKNLFPPSPAL